jgi:hypothetical protein
LIFVLFTGLFVFIFQKCFRIKLKKFYFFLYFKLIFLCFQIVLIYMLMSKIIFLKKNYFYAFINKKTL